MAAPIVVRFQVEGVDQVRRAIRTVEEAVVRGENAATTQTQRAGRARVDLAEREARDKQRIVDKTAKWRSDVMVKSAAMEIAAASKTAKETEKLEDDKRRAIDKTAKWRADVMQRSAAMEIAAAQKVADSQMREASRAHEARMRFAKALVGSAMSGAMSGASGGAHRIGGISSSIVGTALSLGGGFSIADAVQSAQAVNRQAALVSNNSAIKGQAIDKKWASAGAPDRADPAKIAAHARAISLRTGVSAEDLLSGTNLNIKRSSDLSGGMANMETYAKIAVATGGKFSDVTQTAARLRAQSEAENGGKGMSAAEEHMLMLGMHQSGKRGSITMDEMAQIAPKITKSRSRFQGNTIQTQAELLGLAQLAAKSGDSGSAIATTVSNLALDAGKHAGKINAAGGGGRIDDAKTGKLLGPIALIEKIFEKSGGNLSKMGEMGIGARSSKLFGELAGTWENAGGFQDKQKGIAAIHAKMAGFTANQGDEENLEADFKAVEATMQFEKALNELKQTVGQELLPEFVKLVPVLTTMIPLFSDVAKTALPAFIDFIKSVAKFAETNKELIKDIAAHPLGAIMAESMGKAILSAGLGEIMRTSIGQSLGGVGMTIGVAYLTVKALADGDTKRVDETGKSLTEAGNVTSGLRADREGGTVTKEAQADALKKREALVASIKENENSGGGGGTLFKFLAGFGAGVRDGLTGGAFGQVNKVVEDGKGRGDDKILVSQKDALKKLDIQLGRTTTALSNLAKAADAAKPPATNRSDTHAGRTGGAKPP